VYSFFVLKIYCLMNMCC